MRRSPEQCFFFFNISLPLVLFGSHGTRRRDVRGPPVRGAGDGVCEGAQDYPDRH